MNQEANRLINIPGEIFRDIQREFSRLVTVPETSSSNTVPSALSARVGIAARWKLAYTTMPGVNPRATYILDLKYNNGNYNYELNDGNNQIISRGIATHNGDDTYTVTSLMGITLGNVRAKLINPSQLQLMSLDSNAFVWIMNRI